MAWDLETRKKFELLQIALLEAFPSFAALKRMILLGIGENLERISGDGSQALEDVVLKLIQWADSGGREQELVLAAYNKQPGNQKLQVYVKSYVSSTVEQSMAEAVWSISPTPKPEPSPLPGAIVVPNDTGTQQGPTRQPVLLGPSPSSALPMHPVQSVSSVPMLHAGTLSEGGTGTLPVLSGASQEILALPPTATPTLAHATFPDPKTETSPAIKPGAFLGLPDSSIAQPELEKTPSSLYMTSPEWKATLLPLPPRLADSISTVQSSIPSLRGNFVSISSWGKISLAVSDPGGMHLACLGVDEVVRLHKDITTGNSIFHDYNIAPRKASVLSVSPDGLCVAIVYRGQNTIVTVVNAQAHAEIAKYEGHSNEIVAMAWSPDGRYIASASKDGLVHVWQVRSVPLRAPQHSYNNRGGVSCLSWSTDGYIASASQNKVHIWNAHNPDDNLAPFSPGHWQDVTALAWSPDNQLIAVASSSFVHVHHIHEGGSNVECPDDESPGTIAAIAWSPAGTAIVSAGKDMPLRIRDTTSGKVVPTNAENSINILAVTWKKSSEIITVSTDGNILRWIL
jgi:hypothetical protein